MKVVCYEDMSGFEREERHPLVSFLFFAYNQEKFMEAAVSAVLAIDHPSLEIIFSDDCSQDNTFEEIRRVVSTYKGEHQIILNQNKENLNIPDHYNRIVSMARGDLIVVGAGDDISLPHRVIELERVWKESGVSCIFSNSVIIDEDGEVCGELFSKPPSFSRNLDEFKQGKPCWANGASLAIERKIFTKYGDIPTFQEDGGMAFRALLENGVGYIHQPLIQYRQHESGVSSGLSVANRLKFQLNEFFMKKGWYKDAIVSHADDIQLLLILKKQIRKALIKKQFFSIPFCGVFYNQCVIFLKKHVRKNEF